jgi:hypothetical protein
MKRCPQCGAEYDDYVQYCFVDGAELAEAAARPAPAATPAPVPDPPRAPEPAPVAAAPRTGSTGKPAPSRSSSSSLPKPVAVPRPPEPIPPPPRALPMWTLVAVGAMLVAAFGFVSLAGALLVIGGNPTPPVAAQPPPAPPPPPTPTPEVKPPAAAPVLVDFHSEPEGATIMEGDQTICTTPCRVPHPEYAPPERRFVLKLDGYADTEYTMTDPSKPQHIKLSGPVRVQPKPGRPRPGTDEILLGR